MNEFSPAPNGTGLTSKYTRCALAYWGTDFEISSTCALISRHTRSLSLEGTPNAFPTTPKAN